MADRERSGAEDRRKRARQNGVVQPLLTGRLSVFWMPHLLNLLIILITFVISLLGLCNCFVGCNRHI
jgi:hypothetical protein